MRVDISLAQKGIVLDLPTNIILVTLFRVTSLLFSLFHFQKERRVFSVCLSTACESCRACTKFRMGGTCTLTIFRIDTNFWFHKKKDTLFIFYVNILDMNINIEKFGLLRHIFKCHKDKGFVDVCIHNEMGPLLLYWF